MWVVEKMGDLPLEIRKSCIRKAGDVAGELEVESDDMRRIELAGSSGRQDGWRRGGRRRW